MSSHEDDRSPAEIAADAALAAQRAVSEAQVPGTRAGTAAAVQLEQSQLAAERATEALEQLRAELQRERAVRLAAEARAEGLTATAAGSSEGAGTTPVGMVDANALVDAMRNVSVREPAIDKGKFPHWDYAKGEKFPTFERRVELWLSGHGLQHLLQQLPVGQESSVHDKAMAIVSLALPPYDLDYVRGCNSLSDVWASLKAKYMPSKPAEIRSLWDQLSRASLRGPRPKQVQEYCSYILTIVNQLSALGSPPPHHFVANKLFEPLGKDYISLRVGQGDKDYLTLIDEITNHAQALDACGTGATAPGPGGHRNPRQPPPPQQQPPKIAAADVAKKETRPCYNCGKKGHLQKDCPDLPDVVRKFLQDQFGKNLGRKRGKGGKSPSVAVTLEPHELSFEVIAWLAEKFNFLMDSGAEVNVIPYAGLFITMGESDIEYIQPIGPEKLPVLGMGTIAFRVGKYVDIQGNAKDLALEIPNCYFVPSAPFNILSTKQVGKQDIFLHTRGGTKGDVVVLPGFHDQVIGHCEGRVHQSVDASGNPILSITTDPGKPVLRGKCVSNPETWTQANAVAKLENDEDLTSRVSALSRLSSLPPRHKLNCTFLSHLTFCVGRNQLELMCDAPSYKHLRIDKSRIKDDLDNCHGCKVALLQTGSRGNHNLKVTHDEPQFQYPGAWLHADLMGPIFPVGVGKAKYLLIVVDEFSRFCFCIPIVTKDKVAGVLIEIIEHIKCHCLPYTLSLKNNKGEYEDVAKVQVHGIRCDKGGEFEQNELKDYYAKNGIVHEPCDTQEHQGNGIAERMIGVISEHLRAALLPTGLPHRLWPEAAMHVAHAYNLVPNNTMHRKFVDKYVADHLDESLATFKKVFDSLDARDEIRKDPQAPPRRRMSHEDQVKHVKKELNDRKVNMLVRNDLKEVIPYRIFYHDTSDERFKALLSQMRPWGTPLYVFPRSQHMRRLEPRGAPANWVGAGMGPHMNRVYEHLPVGGRVTEVRQSAFSVDMLRQHMLLFDVNSRGHIERVPLDDEELVIRNFPDMVGSDEARVPDRAELDAVQARKDFMCVHGAADFTHERDALGKRLGNFNYSDNVAAELGPAFDVRVHQAPESGELQGRGRQSTPEQVDDLHHAIRSYELGKHNHPLPVGVGENAKRCDNFDNVDNYRQLGGIGVDLPLDTAEVRRWKSPGATPTTGDGTTESVSMDVDEQQHLQPRSAAAGGADPQRGSRGEVGEPSFAAQQSMATAGLRPGEELMNAPPLHPGEREEVNMQRGDAGLRGGFIRERERVSSPQNSQTASGLHPAKEIVDVPDTVAHEQEVQSRLPVGYNPLVRRRLIDRSNVAVIEVSADVVVDQHSTVSEQTVASKHASTDTEATAEGVLSVAVVGQDGQPGGGKSAGRRPSRRVAAIRKRKPFDPDMPSLKEALASDKSEKWMIALVEEADALREHGTYELVELPRGAKAISGKWVLKVKRGPTGEIQRYKARYVARGFTQEEGVDFFETWAPVGSYATLRFLLAIAAQEDLEIKHVDIQCAFLNGKMSETVYVEQPEILNDGTSKVWKLLKTLYGLKQAAREWHKELARLLATMGFVRSHADPALYVRKTGRCFIFLWVDDLFIFSTPTGLQELIDQILVAFEGRDLGDLTWALGAEIVRDRKAKKIVLSQKQKVVNLLEKFSMSDCRPSPTPLVPRQQLRSAKDHPDLVASKAEHARFMSAVGGIQYIAVVTRPDLSYACNALARHMGCSLKEHWQAVQHVLRYLQSTKELGLVFQSSKKSCLLEAYSDADFANDRSLKSISGLITLVYGNPVAWRSKRQPVTAGDTTEAELIAMSSTANELVWSKQLLVDLYLYPMKPVLWGDNKSANILANNPISSDRSRHIRVRHLRVREYVEDDEMRVQWVGTKDQLADAFTKVLPGPALKDVRRRLHLLPS